MKGFKEVLGLMLGELAVVILILVGLWMAVFANVAR
jgi:hypothetical protein